MKQFQWAIAVMCLLLAAWLIIVALAFPAKAEPPEMNAEGLCVVEVKYNPQPETAPIYTDADITALAQMLYGEARGCTVDNQMKCVWCVLNRVDDARFPDSIIGVLKQPHQFYGYSADFPVWDNLYAVALDVMQRWAAEKQGAEVARELGSEYLWFTGDSVENHFRAVY
jgi:spore germination cell wall hydrolase CwlJ-like protein